MTKAVLVWRKVWRSTLILDWGQEQQAKRTK